MRWVQNSWVNKQGRAARYFSYNICKKMCTIHFCGVVLWCLQQIIYCCFVYFGKLCFRYFIFTSFWAYKIYYVYGFMMLVLVILCIVTVCVTIVCTYFLLNAEDYRWWVWLWNTIVSAFTNYLWKVWLPLIYSLLGNGQVFFLLHPLLFMFTCTRFTTTSLKLSKFLVYFNLRYSVGILYTMSHIIYTLGLKIFPN